MYINIIMFDYVRAILGLNLTGNLWELDIRAIGPHVYSSQGAPTGIGNQVSCEFNLLYRWHSAISDRDDKWTTDFTQKLFPDKDIHTLTLDQYRAGLAKWLAKLDEDPSKRNLAMDTVVRGPDGKFDDATLVKIMTESIEDCAGILTTHPSANYSCVRLGSSSCFEIGGSPRDSAGSNLENRHIE
jgi:hypothetical protein